jgi:small GTP-binding protein
MINKSSDAKSEFEFDAFISHSSKDKTLVRNIAQKLQNDGVKIWFDEWQIMAGDNIPFKIEQGLEKAKTLILCISKKAMVSDWVTLESQTFRFRDPLNKQRRFIPLRLDAVEITGSLRQFFFLDWRPKFKAESYIKLLEACLPVNKKVKNSLPRIPIIKFEKLISLEKNRQTIFSSYVFNENGQTVLTAGNKSIINTKGKDSERGDISLWDVRTGKCIRSLPGSFGRIGEIDANQKMSIGISSSEDKIVRLIELPFIITKKELKGHLGWVWPVKLNEDSTLAISGSKDRTIILWDIEAGIQIQKYLGHNSEIGCLAWTKDSKYFMSGGYDGTLRLWEISNGNCIQTFEGHNGRVLCLTFFKQGRFALSGASDNTIRLWDVKSGKCLVVLEGHKEEVRSIAISPNDHYSVTASGDKDIRIWDLETGQCIFILSGHNRYISTVHWALDGKYIYSGDENGTIVIWKLPENLGEQERSIKGIKRTQLQYTNAKVLLVGESSSGKTGLSKRLALDSWEVTDSTIGAWSTQWKLPISKESGIQREIWLWDFGGQADQRLIHQLYMDETALAVLVFDGQKEDLFETLGQWDRDLARATSNGFGKMLVAGRVDAGGLRAASKVQLNAFIKERNFIKYLETSAKTGEGCKELKQAIFEGINWESIPWRSSPTLFKKLKDEIIKIKESGCVILRFNELRERLILSLSGRGIRFSDEELNAVLNLLSGPGVLWKLKFGSWILLQPEWINAYAQVVIQTIREDELERGCIYEDYVLNSNLSFRSNLKRLQPEDERIVLLAMHQMLVERGLCIRDQTEKGVLLIFPSYYRRERPELTGHPAVLVSYKFTGFLDEIYATLIVRLHHLKNFDQDDLWRYAADFRTTTGKNQKLGVKLNRLSEGSAELEIYFDPAIALEEKIIFSRYIHEHLIQNAKEVVRLRHYVCPHCGNPIGNSNIAMKKLQEGKYDIPCVNCDELDKRIPLWDRLEELFASDNIKQHVNALKAKSDIFLDNESKERALVGEVISTVALAGQISREKNVSDHGIDMEIEFKDDKGNATGNMVLLQLKSGNSHLSKRKSDGKEIFNIKKPIHANYWMNQKFPVILVIRNSEGEVRWMEIRNYLLEASSNGKRQIRQIEFKGERFDVMSIRGWREKMVV